MARHEVTQRRGADTAKRPVAAAAARRPKPRPASKGPRKRRPSPKPSTGNPGHFQPGENSHTGERFVRGPDVLPRGSVSSLYRTILDDDGTLEASIATDRSFRAEIARSFLRAARDTESARSGLYAIETIADRLEGRPVQKVEAVNFPQAVFYRQGDPVPAGVAAPETKAEPEQVALDAPATRAA